jgi:pentapeptide repeats protein
LKFNKGNEEMAKWNIWKKITETISKSKARLDEQSNAVKVLCAGAMSIIIFVLAYFVAIKNSNSNGNSVGYWNFIILIVSAPVAFVIWHFRDENNRQQIENQRKDINLKEFQKLSEWVSGAHLPEIKTVSKTTQKSSSKDGAEITEQPTEQSEEYAKRPDTTDFDTFSKHDGAIALQISAIYNLLPFFRGDYGESFRLPAFNLLKSAWQAMQQKSLNRLLVGEIGQENEKSVEDEDIILDEESVKYEVTKKAKSPIGVALTYVLSSLNQSGTKSNLSEFPIELLANLCLAGIDIFGTDLSRLELTEINLYGAKLVKVNLQNSVLYKADMRRSYIASTNLQNAMLDSSDLTRTLLVRADLTGAQLVGANLTQANLININLRNANLQNAVLIDAKLSEVNLQNADLRSAEFEWKNLSQNNNNLRYAKITVNDFVRRIYRKWDKEENMKWSSSNERLHVMQKFFEETGIQIFDEEGNIMVGK